MVQLVKKDIQANHWGVYVGMFGFIILTYLVTLPPTAVFLITVFAITLSAFSYDDKVHANRYLLSMPIDKYTIVNSRYVFGIIIVIATLMMQWITMGLIGFIFGTSLYIYNWHDVLTLFGLACFMIAIFTPVIYFFKSVANAMFIIFALVGISTMMMMNELEKVLPFTDAIIFNDIDAGFALLITRYFPAPAYMLWLIFVGLSLYVSLLLSSYLFKRKDF